MSCAVINKNKKEWLKSIQLTQHQLREHLESMNLYMELPKEANTFPNNR